MLKRIILTLMRQKVLLELGLFRMKPRIRQKKATFLSPRIVEARGRDDEAESFGCHAVYHELIQCRFDALRLIIQMRNVISQGKLNRDKLSILFSGYPAAMVLYWYLALHVPSLDTW